MEGGKVPDQDDFKYASSVWQWIASAIGFGILWWRGGQAAGKSEANAMEVRKDVDEILENGCFSRKDCLEHQKNCQENTWNKFLLSLEKRDRDFDRKFSHICQTLAEIKAEVKK